MSKKHRVCFVDINFFKKTVNPYESNIRKTNKNYKNAVYRRSEVDSRVFGTEKINKDFKGLVDYFPTNRHNDIVKSSDIIIYLYDKKEFLIDHFYKSINILTDFLNRNHINEIELSYYDIEKCKEFMNISLTKLICDKVDHVIHIHVTKEKKKRLFGL